MFTLLKREVSQNDVAMHAFPTASYLFIYFCVLISTFLVHSPSFFMIFSLSVISFVF